jgi:hypothetical protein
MQQMQVVTSVKSVESLKSMKRCDNFVTSVKIVKSLKSMKSVTILKLCGIRRARRDAAFRKFLGGSRFDPPSRGTKFSTISGRVASFLAVL